MYTFGQLAVGDMFNTKSARWVKTTAYYAVCVMSGTNNVGQQCPFKLSDEVIVLWSGHPAVNPESSHASCSESEKEDRFYREIEDKIDAENREREAAALKQSLIDERDALINRRAALIDYRRSLDAGNPMRRLCLLQSEAMCEYIVALNLRLVRLEPPAT